jgi:chemotaxis protein histidine kinase CheA
MAPRGTFTDCLKAAFKWHWNLLAFGAGVVFSFISGKPDVFLPVVAAGEILYLGLLSTHPRFQKSVAARAYNDESSVQRDALFGKIMSSLTDTDRDRFETLKERCRMLNDLGRQIHGTDVTGTPIPEIHLNSLERLLWMFLRLIYSREALDSFLASIDRRELAADLAATEKSLEQAKKSARNENMVRSLDDKMKTLKQRLDNYDQANEKRDLVKVDLDRIEQKITAISESALTSRDIGDINAQVDGISESLSTTANALKEIDNMPRLEIDSAPRFLTGEQK